VAAFFFLTSVRVHNHCHVPPSSSVPSSSSLRVHYYFSLFCPASVISAPFLCKGLFSPSFLFLCSVFLLLPAIVFFSIYGC
jgi:hypothetical protein